MTDSIGEIERLLAEAEQLVDPHARALAKALAAALVELAGAGVRRACELGGDDLRRRLADDELVGNLMVLCELHPDPAAVRAERALEAAAAELGSVGVAIEGVDAAGGGVRVRAHALRGELVDATRVRAVIEAVVVSRAPDVEAIQLELGGRAVLPAGFVPVERLAGA
jgi:hypothetical protein